MIVDYDICIAFEFDLVDVMTSSANEFPTIISRQFELIDDERIFINKQGDWRLHATITAALNAAVT